MFQTQGLNGWQRYLASNGPLKLTMHFRHVTHYLCDLLLPFLPYSFHGPFFCLKVRLHLDIGSDNGFNA